MIAFARIVDADMRAVRKDGEKTSTRRWTKYTTQIAQARFQAYGASSYPDATFTCESHMARLQAIRRTAKTIAPITMMAGRSNEHPERLPLPAAGELAQSAAKAEPKAAYSISSSS